MGLISVFNLFSIGSTFRKLLDDPIWVLTSRAIFIHTLGFQPTRLYMDVYSALSSPFR